MGIDADGGELLDRQRPDRFGRAELFQVHPFDFLDLAGVERGKRNISLVNLKVIATGFRLSLSKLHSGL